MTLLVACRTQSINGSKSLTLLRDDVLQTPKGGVRHEGVDKTLLAGDTFRVYGSGAYGSLCRIGYSLGLASDDVADYLADLQPGSLGAWQQMKVLGLTEFSEDEYSNDALPASLLVSYTYKGEPNAVALLNDGSELYITDDKPLAVGSLASYFDPVYSVLKNSGLSTPKAVLTAFKVATKLGYSVECKPIIERL